MRSRRSSLSRSRAALPAAFATLALPLQAIGAQSPRAAVTLDVRVDGPLYRTQLGDDACTARCVALRAVLADSVRAAFERSFGFLEWRPTAAPDTLVVAWVNSEAQTGKLALSLRGKHARRGTRTTFVPFESFNAIATRRSDGPRAASPPPAAWRWR